MTLVRVEVGRLGMDRNHNTPVVLLDEREGERTLPIWIGPAEASAIAMRLAGMEFKRPLTHDLLAAAIERVGGRVERAVVSHIKESTFFAELHLEGESGHIVLDCRPSDAIAVALRAEAEIFVEEDLLDAAAAHGVPAPNFGEPETPHRPAEPPELLETERLRLRRLTAADADAVFNRWAQDPVVSRYLAWRPHESLAESVAHAKACEARWSRRSEFTWMIEDLETGVAVGSISAHRSGSRIALGYLLARDSWGKGYMTEAVKRLTEWFLALPDVFRVWAVCDTDNPASAHVLERSGFELEGTLHRWADHPNISSEPRDVLCFARVQ